MKLAAYCPPCCRRMPLVMSWPGRENVHWVRAFTWHTMDVRKR